MVAFFLRGQCEVQQAVWDLSPAGAGLWDLFFIFKYLCVYMYVCVYVCFKTVSCSPGWPQTCYVAEDGLELLILLLLPLRSKDYRPALLCLFQGMF